jgi:hypothetical protein
MATRHRGAYRIVAYRSKDIQQAFPSLKKGAAQFSSGRISADFEIG